MNVEYKAAPSFVFGIDDRTVTGVFAVHGTIDDGGDRSHPGLFGDGTVNGRKRTVFLWQHDATQPPTAKINRVFEVMRTDLPAPVLLYAPDASGGVAVERTYLDTPRGNEILAGLKAGAITEMSYAYDPKQWDFEEIETREFPIRNLYKADLLDISDVAWGMNPATSADGAKQMPLEIEHQTVHAAVAAYTQRLQALASLRAKEGRVLSGANRKRIEDAIEAISSARDALKALLDLSEPEKNHPDLRRASQAAYREWTDLQRRITALRKA